MSIAINARPATLIAQTTVKRGPEAVPRPSTEASEQRTVRTDPASALTKAAGVAKLRGATVTHAKAQELTNHAQPTALVKEPDLPPDAPVFGDLNGDGELTTQDITSLMQAFRSSVDAADLNKDGTVDTADLGILISAIRDLTNNTRPTNGPGDGPPSGDLNPLSGLDSVKPDPEEALVSDNKPAEANRGNPLAPAHGEGEDPVAQPAIFGDLDGNGAVDRVDLQMLQKSFGSTAVEGQMMGDLNGDGTIDTADLGTMIGLMGKHDHA